jgi:hypothetical protein
LHGGYGSMRSNGTYDEAGDNGGFVLDANGFAGGGQLGYNVQRGAWVYGVEIDGTWTGLDKGRTDGEGDTQKSKITSLASARGRLGVVAENKMFFITAGVGYVRGKFQVNEGGVPASVSYSQVVPVLGSGVEWAFAPNWLLRVEGLTYLADKRINTSALTGDSEPEDFVRFGTASATSTDLAAEKRKARPTGRAFSVLTISHTVTRFERRPVAAAHTPRQLTGCPEKRG